MRLHAGGTPESDKKETIHMKKLGIFCAALLALGFASCDDKSDLGIAQTNPQETVMSANGVTVDFGSGIAGNALDLNQYLNYNINTPGTPIPVIKLVEAKDLPEGASISYVMQLSADENFTNPTSLAVTDGCVDPAEWDMWFRNTLGKSPAAKDNWVRFAAYIAYNGQLSRVGTEDTWFAAKKLTVTPIPLDITIEDSYYLIGTLNGWALDNSFAFKHNDAVSVYDDPNFTITVEITEEEAAAGWWWKIAPASAVAEANWDKVIGTDVDGNPALEGKLVDTNAQAGCIKEAGTFMMTINLMDMTYSFKKLSYLYTPGNSNGWNQASSQMLSYDAEAGIYKGLAYLDGEFKFTNQADWNGINYGAGDAEGTLSTDSGAGNLTAEKGLYYITVNVDELTYTMTPITTWGMIGDFNSWGASEALTPSDDFLTWTGTLTLGEGQGWKFRANDGWDINLGGALENLTFNGDNIATLGAGTYEITLNLATLPYNATAVKK